MKNFEIHRKIKTWLEDEIKKFSDEIYVVKSKRGKITKGLRKS